MIVIVVFRELRERWTDQIIDVACTGGTELQFPHSKANYWPGSGLLQATVLSRAGQ